MRSAMLIRTPSFLGSPPVGGDSSTGGDAMPSPRWSRSASTLTSPRWAASLHLDAKQKKDGSYLLRRARSEADIVGWDRKGGFGLLRSPIPSRVAEVEEEVVEKKAELGVTSGFDLAVGMWPSATSPAKVAAVEEVEFPGGGIGFGGGRGGDDGSHGGGAGDQNNNNNNRRMGEYYKQMINSDPSNALLLRNYGRFLHEVVGDTKGAEEYYGRAILANPGDGEVLSLYGKLLWETRKDGERAGAYFERAVVASPDDCFVLGSYAQFLWDAEEEEGEKKELEQGMMAVPSPLVEVF